MSWLGVNLNQSISSITGQISSFTRDVLAEENEIKDDETEVLVPKKKLKELETTILIEQQEIKELRSNRVELEDRLRAAEYNNSQKNTLQKQLNETQKELQLLKEKSTEWGWEIGLKDDGKGSSPQGYQLPESFYIDKISNLETSLEAERVKHEDAILAIQDAHSNEIRRVKAIENSSEVLGSSNIEEDGESAKDERIRQVEEKLSSLQTEHDALLKEKDGFNSSLEELDAQHQLIIEDFLKSKKRLAKDLEDAKNEIRALEQSKGGGQTPSDDESTLRQKVEELQRDNESLKEELAEAKKKKEQQGGGNPKGKKLQIALTEAQNQVTKLTSQLVEGKEKETASQLEVSRLSGLVSESEGELKTLKKREESLRQENAVLKQRSDAIERELRYREKTVEEQGDKILSLEEEVLKFEAVLEEKNSEHTAAFWKLKQHEDLTKQTIKEFQEEKKALGDKILVLERERSDSKEKGKDSKVEDVVKELADKLTVQNFCDLPSAVTELNSEIASLRCERDRLAEELSSTVQDLRDTQELMETLEGEKGELEKDCEDLRDQLEELQCGERATPEGSLTPRSLPTIEEEEVDPNSPPQEGEGGAKSSSKKEVDEGMLEKISHLNSQVTALGEARQNLEMELSTVKREKKEGEQRLSELSLQLGNMSNLEVEAVSLRSENESLQGQLNGSNAHCCSEIEEEKGKLETQIHQMTNAMRKMNFDSAHLLCKEEEYERERAKTSEQISAQNKTIHEYFHEIARLKSLLNESSQATSLVAGYQDTLSTMQDELDKVKGLVIYKDDQIDQLKQGIEQIGEIFDIRDGDLRQTYVRVKQEHFSLVTKLKEAKEEVEALKEENEELKTPADEAEEREKTQADTLRRLKSDLEVTNTQMTETQIELERFKETTEMMARERESELQTAKLQCENLLAEKNDLLDRLTREEEEKGKVLAQIQLQGNESSENLDSVLIDMDAEIEKFAKEIKDKEAIIEKLEAATKDKEENWTQSLKTLQDQLSLKEREVEALNNLVTKTSSENSASNDKKMENVQKDLDEALSRTSVLTDEITSLRGKMSEMQVERQQLIDMSTQKHQESITYYTEIQRLNALILKEKEVSTAELESLKQQLQTAVESQHEAAQRVNSLQLNLSEAHANFIPKTEAAKLQEQLSAKTEELSKQQDLRKSLEKERDHLRLANSTFNSQYEEKSKEVSSLQEKEKHLSQEIQRLKQHLVEVEETYTSEAEKSEQREATLRQSLAKMHEKLASHSTHYSNTNQKTAAQLDAIQEQLHEAVHQRDEAKMQLQSAEEASLQHQDALTRLQNVLQDFQKNQARDIAMATERERRKFEEERQKNSDLQIEFNKLKQEMDDSEQRARSMQSLRDDLQAKEDTVVALKSQVQAVQMAAKKHQEQLAVLQSSSDAKVDKHLVRNLIVGYFATPSDKQREVLRIVAQVLDFSPEERARSGIDLQPGSWLTSIANFLAPPPSNMRVASKVDLLDHSSLSQAFIRFLEEESLPRAQPRLPAVQMAEEANQKAQKKAQAKMNSFVSPEAPPFGPFPTSTSSSSSPPPPAPPPTSSQLPPPPAPLPETSNSLLSSASAPLPGSFPVISTPALPTAPIPSPLEVSTPKFLNNLLNPKDESESSS